MNNIPVGYLLTYNNRKRGTTDNWMSYDLCSNVAESVIENKQDADYECHLINVYPLFNEEDYRKLSYQL